MNELWTTIVGSHVWQMNNPNSDTDLFTAYIIPTEDILSGRNRGNGSHNYQSVTEDRTSHEIGKIINELIKGNINFLVGTLSYLVIHQHNNCLNDLKYLLKQHGQTKACVNSIKGLATSNYKKYIVNCNSEKKEHLVIKKCGMINRTLLFGIGVLEGNGFNFMPIVNQTPTDVKEMLDRFNQAVIDSTLPEKTYPDPFRNYLFNLRLKELDGKKIF